MYNGWSNFETWLLNLVLSNEHDLYNEVLEFMKSLHSLSMSRKTKEFKQWLIGKYYNFRYHVFNIDCETFSNREFEAVNFYETLEHFEEILQEHREYEKEKEV